MQSGTQDQYEIFISYARKDNRQLAGGERWITQLRDCILQNHRRFSTDPLRIFFDTSDIRDMDDWRSRILRGLRESHVLLVCLSPDYLASHYCRWEWDEYRNRFVHVNAGSDTIAVVCLSRPARARDPAHPAWLEQLRAIQHTDLSEWFPSVTPAGSDEIRRRVAALCDSLWMRVQRARRSATVSGNVRRPNPHFVGRAEELEALHEKLAAGAQGAVAVLHGLGGLGKTELAVAYAHGWAYAYPAGIWMLRAEGKKEMLSLLGELAYAPELQLRIPKGQRAGPRKLGRTVLAELVRRAQQADDKRRREERSGTRSTDDAAAALIILDNVDQAALLSASQLVALSGSDRVRILATTRLGRPQLGGGQKFLDLMPVDSLDVETGVALIREHQPPRDAGGWRPDFASRREESAARAIARELDGFTLAIEQVAVHLGLNPGLKPSAFLKGLRERGLTRTDEVAAALQGAGREGDILHREKQLRIVLHATLDRLGAPAPPVSAGRTMFEVVQQQRRRAPARTALEFAARLSPDLVPWPWLRELTVRFHPELIEHAEDEPDPWDDIRRQLEGLRMLVQTNIPEHARMHRMMSAHLRTPPADADFITVSLAAALDVPVRDFLAGRIEALCSATKPPPLWELDALIENLPPVLRAGCEQRVAKGLSPLASATRGLANKVVAYRGTAAAVPLLDAVAEVTHRFAEQGAELLQRTDLVALNTAFEHAMSCAQQGELAANEGDAGRGQELTEQARATLEVLVAAVPEDESWQRELSVIYEKQGDQALRWGTLDEAASKYAAALEISREIASRHPDGVVQQDELAESILKMGDVAQAQGRTDDARQLFDEALQLRRRLLDRNERNAAVEKGVCVLLSRLARVSLNEGCIDGVASYISECVKRASKLVGEDPDNLDRQESLSSYYLLASDYSQAVADLDGAYKYRIIAAGLISEIATKNRRSARAQARLLDVLVELGDLAVKRADTPAARGHFELAMRAAMTIAIERVPRANWRDRMVAIQERVESLQTNEERSEPVPPPPPEQRGKTDSPRATRKRRRS